MPVGEDSVLLDGLVDDGLVEDGLVDDGLVDDEPPIDDCAKAAPENASATAAANK